MEMVKITQKKDDMEKENRGKNFMTTKSELEKEIKETVGRICSKRHSLTWKFGKDRREIG